MVFMDVISISFIKFFLFIILGHESLMILTRNLVFSIKNKLKLTP